MLYKVTGTIINTHGKIKAVSRIADNDTPEMAADVVLFAAALAENWQTAEWLHEPTVTVVSEAEQMAAAGADRLPGM